MPNDERGHNFRNQQEGLNSHPQGGSSGDSMSGLTLTIALFGVLGVLVVLLVLLLR
jgi:hypothetical protein